MYPNLAKIMSLGDPSKKMSKSDKNEATLYILDEPDQIKKKISSAITDSGSEIKSGPEKLGFQISFLSIPLYQD